MSMVQINDVSLGVDEQADAEMFDLRSGHVVRDWNQRYPTDYSNHPFQRAEPSIPAGLDDLLE